MRTAAGLETHAGSDAGGRDHRAERLESGRLRIQPRSAVGFPKVPLIFRTTAETQVRIARKPSPQSGTANPLSQSTGTMISLGGRPVFMCGRGGDV